MIHSFFSSSFKEDDLNEFVNNKLFPYFRQFKVSADNANTLEYKIGEIFSEINNRIQQGYTLREVINKIDKISFLSNEDKHELSSLYEDKIKNMGYSVYCKQCHSAKAQFVPMTHPRSRQPPSPNHTRVSAARSAVSRLEAQPQSSPALTVGRDLQVLLPSPRRAGVWSWTRNP